MPFLRHLFLTTAPSSSIPFFAPVSAVSIELACISLKRLAKNFGSPGIAVMDHQYDRVKECPGTMIAAQVHWGRRDGQFHSGAIALA
jgi:hypothetical protein